MLIVQVQNFFTSYMQKLSTPQSFLGRNRGSTNNANSKHSPLKNDEFVHTTSRSKPSSKTISEDSVHSVYDRYVVAGALADKYEAMMPDFSFSIEQMLKNALPANKMSLEYRSKSKHSIGEKMTAQKINSLDDAKEYIRDGLGVRIVLEDGLQEDAARVINAIVKGLNNTGNKFMSINKLADYTPYMDIVDTVKIIDASGNEKNIDFNALIASMLSKNKNMTLDEVFRNILSEQNGTSIHRNTEYIADKKYSIVTQKSFDTLKDYMLENFNETDIYQKAKNSGYTSLHLVGKMLAKDNRLSTNSPSEPVWFEIQLTTRNTLELYEAEHAIFKMSGRKSVEDEYDPILNELKKLSTGERREYHKYLNEAYKFQRNKDFAPRKIKKAAKSSEAKLLPLSLAQEANVRNFSPLLDLNHVLEIAQVVERNLQREEKERLASYNGTTPKPLVVHAPANRTKTISPLRNRRP